MILGGILVFLVCLAIQATKQCFGILPTTQYIHAATCWIVVDLRARRLPWETFGTATNREKILHRIWVTLSCPPNFSAAGNNAPAAEVLSKPMRKAIPTKAVWTIGWLAYALIGLIPFVAYASPVPPTPISWADFLSQNQIWVCMPDGKLFKATLDGWQMIMPQFCGPYEITSTSDGTFYIYNFDTYEIYHSTNGGETWFLTGKVPAIPLSTQGGHIFPSPKPSVIFLGATDAPFVPDWRGVYKSTDSGATWKRVLANGDGNWVDFSPGFAQDGTAFAAITEYHASLGIWKTTNWGETWFPVTTGLYTGTMPWGVTWVAVSPQFPQDQT
jgi:hypothetical protein